jgi:hypothetical protein
MYLHRDLWFKKLVVNLHAMYQYQCNVLHKRMLLYVLSFIEILVFLRIWYEKTNNQLSKRKYRTEIDEQSKITIFLYKRESVFLLIDEFDERSLSLRRDQCLPTSDGSNYDQTKKLSIEMVDKQVSTSYSNSTIKLVLFISLNRMPIFLMNILVCQLDGMYTESTFRIIMILALLYLVNW